ncbi:Aldo/keto reductase family protein [Xylophilus ampelinus]|nr:Aldo/keto reductase family protein [Xylophilus ampelinus]
MSQEAAAKRIVDVAFDGGINFFDTADVYSHGQSVGKALKGKRHEVVVTTKVRGRMSREINDVGLSSHLILQSADAIPCARDHA